MNLNKALREVRQQVEWNWPTPSPSDSLIWLLTEVGELADELMRYPGFPDVKPSRNNPGVSNLDAIAEEAADVLIMLTTVAEHYNVNLELAYRDKLQKLLERWS